MVVVSTDEGGVLHIKIDVQNITPEIADLRQEVADLHSIVRLLNERLAKLERAQ